MRARPARAPRQGGVQEVRRGGRSGFSLVEVMIAGSLMLVVVQAAWWSAAVQGGVASRLVREARLADETRLIRHLLATETGHGRPGIDWRAAGDSLALRAFRGIGFACRSQSAAGLAVAVSGYRSTNPAKDSVVVFGPDSGWQASNLVRVSSAAGVDCPSPDGFDAEVWTLDPARPGALAAAYFERGAYRFSADAFRYRTGSRWQPLTSTDVEADSAWIRASGSSDLSVAVGWQNDDLSGPSGGSVRVSAWTLRGIP